LSFRYLKNPRRNPATPPGLPVPASLGVSGEFGDLMHHDGDGQVLLLRHRLWPPDRQWGFPTGYAIKGERHEDTIAREVREETGLTVKAGRLLKVRSGCKHTGNSPQVCDCPLAVLYKKYRWNRFH
jgi:8-oxo-dGTP pyrophosphatase MutT (NUDIX family)